MENKNLEIKTSIQVLKPAGEVFEAIVNPEHMKQYFISQSSGRMEAGKNLVWKFPEFDADCPVRVEKIEQDKFISFFWDIDGNELLVEMELESNGGQATVLSVFERSMPNNEAGIRWLKGNTEGWANFLACLKAYLEYGINLRKGAFDYAKKG